MKHLGFASFSAVRQYLRYAEHRGLNLEAALATAQIDTAILNEQEGRLPGKQFESLIRTLIERANDPLLGLHSSEFVQPDSYSLLGHITLRCQTIGEAIEHIPPFEKLVGDMGVTTIGRTGHIIYLDWHCAYPDPLVRPQMIDNVLASWTRYARWLAQANTAPEYIELEREAPTHANSREEYARFFGCPVHYSRTRNRIALHRQLLDLPLRQADANMLSQFEQQARRELSALEEKPLNTSIRVAQGLRIQLRMGVTDKALIAAQLGMTPRTLQRHLASEDNSYRNILDEVRAERAQELLANTHLGITDIAFNLGFSDARAFHRRFKHWYDCTPGQFRDHYLRGGNG